MFKRHRSIGILTALLTVLFASAAFVKASIMQLIPGWLPTDKFNKVGDISVYFSAQGKFISQTNRLLKPNSSFGFCLISWDCKTPVMVSIT